MSTPPNPAAGGSRRAGIALITSMLLVALGTLLAVSLTRQTQIDIRRTDTLLLRGQAVTYAQAITDWAGLVLERDGKQSRTDHSHEPWATLLPPIAIDAGTLFGFIEDLQGKFNLNNLAGDQPANKIARLRFIRLLDHLGLEPGILDAVVDWVDADSDPSGAAGAEDDYYSRLRNPYRTANRPLADVTELRQVRYIDPSVYTMLFAHVCALPPGTPLNVNTANPVLLAILAEGTPVAKLQEIVAVQDSGGFANVQAFRDHDAFRDAPPEVQGLTVQSGFFVAHTVVTIGDFSLRQTGLLRRNPRGEVASTARRYGTFD